MRQIVARHFVAPLGAASIGEESYHATNVLTEPQKAAHAHQNGTPAP
jgi:hypothetical protein